MLHYLVEDPWPLASILGLLALVGLVVTKVTQQGRYLIGAGVALGLGLVLIGVERAWVTDAERIEAVVYDLAKGVAASDVDRVLGHLAPDAVLIVGEQETGEAATAATIQRLLESSRFDYVRASRVRAKAGRMSRTGTAEFRVDAMGTFQTGFGTLPRSTPPEGIHWSLGFQEDEPGRWQITRITPLRAPFGLSQMLGMSGLRYRSPGRPPAGSEENSGPRRWRGRHRRESGAPPEPGS